MRNLKLMSWPDAEIEDLLIGEDAISSMRVILEPFEKESWRGLCKPSTGEPEIVRLALAFRGHYRDLDKALNVASRRQNDLPTGSNF